MVLTLFHGAFCIIAQAILLRELGDLFKGNEAVLGLFLAAWLLGGGLGTWLFTRLPEKLRALPGGPAGALFLSSLMLPLAILAVRLLFSALRFQALPNLLEVSALAFLITAPVGAAVGLTFSFFAQKVFSLEKGDTAARAEASSRGPGLGSADSIGDTAKAYLWEAAGAFGGGLLYAFGLVGWLDSMVIALFIPAVALFLGSFRPVRRRRWISVLSSLAWLVLVGLNTPGLADLSRAAQFHGSQLIEVSHSRYGILAQVSDAGQTLAYYNGEVLYDPQATSWEEEAYLPVMIGNEPKKILFPGFPLPPLFEKMANLHLQRIVMISPDENLSLFLTKIVPGTGFLNNGVSLQWISDDPIHCFRNLQGLFDLVMLSRVFPRTVAENRYFTNHFFLDLKTHLAPGGVVAFSLPYEENKPDPGTLRILRIIRRTLSSCFAHVAVVPGERFHFFASDSPMDFEPLRMLRRLDSLGLQTKVFNQGWIDHYLEPGRISRFDQWTTPLPQDPVNSPFGSALYQAAFTHWVRSESGTGWVIPILLLAVLIFLLFRRLPRILAAFKAGEKSGALFVVGFAAMAAEICFLEDYQGLCGFLFGRYALLAASFMLGTALGAWMVLRRPGSMTASTLWQRGVGGDFVEHQHGKSPFVPLFLRGKPLCFAASLLGLALWASCAGLLRLMDPATPYILIEVFAGFLNLLGGLASGVVFTLAAKETRGQVNAAEANTSLYAFDLFGSALAAFIAPFVLIPLGGTALTQWLAAFLVMGFVAAKWKTLKGFSHG